VVFIEYINKFFIPVRDLSAKYAVMQGAMAASERIFSCRHRGVGRREPPSRALGAPMDPGKRAAASKDGPAIELVTCSSRTAPSRAAPASICACHAARRSPSSARPAAAVGRDQAADGLYERDRGAIRPMASISRDLPLAELRERITVVSQT